MHHTTDRVAHTTAFVTSVVEHWFEREIAHQFTMTDRSDNPLHNEQMFLPCCYISLPSVIKILVFSDTTKLLQIQLVLPYINNNNDIILSSCFRRPYVHTLARFRNKIQISSSDILIGGHGFQMDVLSSSL